MVKRKYFVKRKNFIIAYCIDTFGRLVAGLLKLISLPYQLLEKANKLDAKKIEEIIVIKLEHIGDVLLTTPALKCLRELYPEAKISCLIGSWAKEILFGNPNVDEIITWNAPWQNRNGIRDFSIKNFLSLLRTFRKRRFDLAIIFRPDIRDLFLGYLTGAKRRIGYGIKGGGFLLTEEVPYEEEKHILEQILDVVRYLGCMNISKNLEVFFLPEDEIYINKLIDTIKFKDNFLIGINPCAGFPIKHWTNKKFAELCDALIEKYNAEVIITGSFENAETSYSIKKLMKREPVILAGKTNLRQLTALISKLDLLITVDSAPCHIASALNIPIVLLFSGTNSYIVWGPYKDNHYVIRKELECSPCHEHFSCPKKLRNCMTMINPSDVLKGVEESLFMVKKFNKYSKNSKVKM